MSYFIKLSDGARHVASHRSGVCKFNEFQIFLGAEHLHTDGGCRASPIENSRENFEGPPLRHNISYKNDTNFTHYADSRNMLLMEPICDIHTY